MFIEDDEPTFIKEPARKYKHVDQNIWCKQLTKDGKECMHRFSSFHALRTHTRRYHYVSLRTDPKTKKPVDCDEMTEQEEPFIFCRSVNNFLYHHHLSTDTFLIFFYSGCPTA